MTPVFFASDSRLQQQLSQVLEITWARFPTLARNQLAVTWLLYEPPYRVNTDGALSPTEFWKYQPQGATYRGVERIYPASVVKLIYLIAAHEWLERGMMQSSSELERAMQDMIVDSSNDATGYVVDALTGTTSGPELPQGPFQTWQHQRNLVNRYLKSLKWPELETVNANQKTWCDGPFGRERAFVGPTYDNRNMLTTEAIARMLHGIIGGVAVSPSRSQELMDYLKRDLTPEAIAQLDPDYNQITGFLGESLPPTAKLWSKAGWMSRVRLDAAYIELPDAFPYLVSVAIDSPLGDRDRSILPFISAHLQQSIVTLEKSSQDA